MWLYVCLDWLTQHNNNNKTIYCPLSVTTRVSWYQKKHSPTHHPDHHPIFISFFHLPRSIASSLFKLHAWQSFCTTSLHVLFGLPLGLEPSTSYSIHFFTQSVSYFRSKSPYHRNLFYHSIKIILSIPSISLNSLLGTLSFTSTLHIHLTILISARWSAISCHNCWKCFPTLYTAHLCTLDLGNETLVLQLQPVGLIQLRADEEVEVADLVVLSDERGRQAELRVRLDGRQHASEHLGRNVLNLCRSKQHHTL